MLIKNSHSPEVNISILARLLLETFEGNTNKVFYKMKFLSQCKKEYCFKYHLSKVLIFPGTPNDMSIEVYNELYAFFKDCRDFPAYVDLLIRESLYDEAEIYCTRTKEDEEDLLLYEAKK
jgi:hypothetical protein